MFPTDALTITLHAVGATTTELLTIPNGQTYTLLGFAMEDENNGAGNMDWVQYAGTPCADANGSAVLNCYIAHAAADDGSISYETQIKATSSLFYTTQGTASQHHYIVLTYVARDISLTSSTATTSAPAVINGFTYGEIVNGIFLFLTFVAACAVLFHLWFGRTKIKN